MSGSEIIFERPKSPEEWEKSYSDKPASREDEMLRHAELCAWNWMCRAEEAERKLRAIKELVRESQQ